MFKINLSERDIYGVFWNILEMRLRISCNVFDLKQGVFGDVFPEFKEHFGFFIGYFPPHDNPQII